MKLRDFKNSKERASYLEKKLTISLSHCKKIGTDLDPLAHCENRIGSIVLPLGVAGPMNIIGQYVQGEYYVPLATTEGALVASVNRGAAATFKSGITTSVEKKGVTRGPVLKTKTIGEAQQVEKWINNNIHQLKNETEKKSAHIHLIDVITKRVGMYLYIRFSFDTDKAMGMNMATRATESIGEYIAKHTHSFMISIAGNFDIDKKPAWLNALYGRGYSVHAESIVSPELTKKILKTTPQKITELWKIKCLIGSALSGSIGFNAHHANIVAAFYAATGQDLAHVVEGSLGMTVMDILDDGSLYISVQMPCVMMGIVGGGTNLTTQTEARNITKGDSPEALSEIVASAVLSGELSLLASLSEGTLVKAHTELGR